MLIYANMVLDKAGKWVDSLKSKHSRLGYSAISFKLLCVHTSNNRIMGV